MSSSAITEATDATARFFSGVGGSQFLTAFKGFTLTTIAPIILIVIFTVIVVNILAYLLADSPGHYPPYGKKLALAAADMWSNRDQYGFATGRTLETMGPVANILDAISSAVQKWEDTSTPLPQTTKPFQQEVASSNYIQSSPHFITKPSFQTQNQRQSSGKIRFE